MQIIKTRFGEVAVDPNTILTFPRGLPGFEQFTRFKLLHEDKPQPKVLWLQSLDDENLAFSVVTSELLGVNYQIQLSDDECQLLELENPDDVTLLLVLAKQESGQPFSANTQAPLVINVKSRLGLQKTGLQADIVFRNAV
ncbi:flagellar assembly factor FliW [Chitiniphilus shinanonensis]|uniref:Flagellar assembly factor FliW n=1 Tax=Chitiniphilus shinanonensis TaxID=553088 RepID=A0ABQ6BQK5_9NEIS|nr:flagellar assembly protein FliW [Chitiniphilus shinanonensis]GLS04268.1 flagellar assembly factor FliW [Chitiniphilus shinanonensis]